MRDAGCETRRIEASRSALEASARRTGSCLGLPLCLLVRAASRPRPARGAGGRLLARAVSLDRARTSKPVAWCRRWVLRRREGHHVAYLSRHLRGVEAVAAGGAAH